MTLSRRLRLRHRQRRRKKKKTSILAAHVKLLRPEAEGVRGLCLPVALETEPGRGRGILPKNPGQASQRNAGKMPPPPPLAFFREKKEGGFEKGIFRALSSLSARKSFIDRAAAAAESKLFLTSSSMEKK